MSLLARVVTLVVAFLLVAAGVAFLVVHYLLGSPPTIAFGSNVTPDTGAVVNVVMQEDPQNTVTAHPDWVSYFIQDPNDPSVGAHDGLPSAGRVVDPHDDLRLRRLHAAAEQLLEQGDRHHRRGRARQRQTGEHNQRLVRLQCGAHVLDP